MKIEPVTLEGPQVRLEPLSLERHFDDLCRVGLDQDLWCWSTVDVRSPGDLRSYLESALQERAEGRALPFATVARAAGRAVGSTRFGSIAVPHRRVEIGWTWIGRGWQRSAINTEAKYLMLRHAFETWGCLRVELKTDALNRRSRDAMLRIGCREEGTLRKHMLTERGTVRDSVCYSIVDEEWPAVRARLEEMMRREYPPATSAFAR
ncbi:MAG: GNAT family N-acetyltransferase [Candidatus Eisenbacteria bacterium]|nr:GNAT family N-acetyltransferase [Candidatus Eisenbacteria bacterium]